MAREFQDRHFVATTPISTDPIRARTYTNGEKELAFTRGVARFFFFFFLPPQTLTDAENALRASSPDFPDRLHRIISGATVVLRQL